MNWNDDDLIEQVKKYPVLYRDKRKNYKNIIKKGNCWIQIAAALNKTPEECKSKWRNIRDSYLKNQKKKLAGDAPSYSKYFDEKLNFLSEAYETGETSSNNISADDSPSSPSNNIESFDIVVKEEYDAFAEVPPTESTFSYSAANSPDDSVPIITSVTPAPSRTPAARRAYKRKLDAIVDEMKKDREERNQIFKSLVDRNSGGQTSTHKFFSCMADIVSNFPLEKIAEIRMKIYSMVNDMELSIMKENSQ
ncbi:unnamed protein product [Spodoptera exigua]|nr:unnamed protein product [Spodoptera exigua]